MAPWRVEVLRPQGHPTESEWWPSGKSGQFFNAGRATWENQRAAWNVKTVTSPPPKPPPVPYDEIVGGLTQVVRTYELPGRMSLEDIVDVYNDIWECEQGF